MREECTERHEFPGSAFNQLILIDTVVPHKKREVFTPKVRMIRLFHSRLSSAANVIKSVEVSLFDASIVEHFIIEAVFLSTVSPYQTDSSCSCSLVLLHIDVPVIIRVLLRWFSLSLDSSSDYMHKALQDQFDVLFVCHSDPQKLKGITVSSGRSSHFFRGRGRGRRGASVSRGGRGGKRLFH